MKKNNLNNKSIVNVFRAFSMFAVVLMVAGSAFGQIAAWDFTGNNTATATFAATTFNANLVSTPNITRGTGAVASAANNSFRTTGFQNNGIATTNTDYFQVTLTANAGNTLSISTIDARLAGTASYTVAPGVTSQFAYSTDGVTFTLIGSPQVIVGTPQTLVQINTSGISALQNLPAGTTVTLRYYASGQTTTGGWGFNSSSLGQNGLAIGGYAGPFDILTPNALPNAVEMSPYTTPLVAAGGVSPYTYAVTAGALPAGLTLNTNGTWAGMPSMGTAGVYGFSVTATDSNPFSFSKGQSSFAPNTVTKPFSLRVTAPSAASANVTGRLFATFGRSLANASVSITNASTGEIKRTRSNQRGYFNFLDMEVGNLYIIEVQSKRFVFNNYSFTLNEDLTDLVLTAQ
jgi:Putative Ig domain/Carboxypeptidase regulatory-like domain